MGMMVKMLCVGGWVCRGRRQRNMAVCWREVDIALCEWHSAHAERTLSSDRLLLPCASPFT